ncbi:MAG: response regulator transcription factor [Dehalococcoidia bacterium]|nr:response regulator transcription factor [Dehalococcoidia bacterium]
MITEAVIAMLSLLVVDPLNLPRQALVALLSLQPGFSVVAETESYADVTLLARRHQPRVAVVVARGGLLTVIPTVQQIRADLPTMPIVTVGSRNIPEAGYALVQAGATGYLSPEASATELFTAIQTVAGGEAYLTAEIARELLNRARGRNGVTRMIGYFTLSEREREVLRGIVEGDSNQEIAARAGLSPNTVQTHRSHILAKLRVGSTAQLVRYAVSLGLIDA